MAKIGLKYPVYKGTSSGVLGKGIKADVKIEMNDIQLYGDDGIAESHKSFKKGTITVDTTNMTKTDKSLLLGHVVVGNEITSNQADAYPYVGFGFYGAELIDNVVSYRAIWLPKVQFSEPADNNETKKESLAFGTHSLDGTILTDTSGDWKKEESFTLEADAIAYLNTKAGIPVDASTGLSALSLAGTGGTLSPAFGAAIRYYTFGGVSAASVTVTPTAASHIIQLLVDGVFVQNIISGQASSAIEMAIGTKKLTLIAQEAGKQSQTTEIIVVKTS
ncbi:MAG: major tail protein [Kiritimatiellales bacterium]